MITRTDSDLSLVTRLYRISNALVRELDFRLEQSHGVTFIQAVSLLAIDSSDGPRPHQVAGMLHHQSQTVTGVLDRLERMGYINRRRDLADRRGVRLELTEAGQTLVAELKVRLSEHLDQALRGIDEKTRARLSVDAEWLEKALVLSATTA
jgi:DNA-binding MarR family transcriptional regulator